MLDFRNVNTLWASILVETFYRLGLTTAIICPGSRSTPLTIAFAQHSHIKAIPILDERSAAFFALGIAKKNKLPVALVCTSGTAGANFYPAIIEAKESQIPLIVLTADRPPELRYCHAGQTIDQVRLYGNYTNWYLELALPAAELAMLRYLRQNLMQAWQKTFVPNGGVVHLNLPFREPLAPTVDRNIESLQSQFATEAFFAGVTTDKNRRSLANYEGYAYIPIQEWLSSDRGIIIAGLAQPEDPQEYCRSIAFLSKTLQFPVLAEALSPLRNYAVLNPYLISSYDLILRNSQLRDKLTPDIAIQIGELPTSKELRNWLDGIETQRWIIDRSGENFDPLHGNTLHLRISLEQLSKNIFSIASTEENQLADSQYLKNWCDLEGKARQKIDLALESIDFLYEGKATWIVSRSLPEGTPIFFANSMTVRNAEFFWQTGNSGVIPYFNRGTNGIDGNLSTALGIAYNCQPALMLTGDLAILHDTNGFLVKKQFLGHLTIILINNNGGGIFEMLPISQFELLFEDFFATPQDINFQKLAATYEIEYYLIDCWEQLQTLLKNLPDRGIRLLEIPTNRKVDALWLQNNFKNIAQDLM